jgi:AraC-like DNA-binding protein
MEAFSALAMRELEDEALGWFSRRFPWGANGMLCRASLPSENLRVALARWCRHHAMLTEDVRLEISEDKDFSCLSIQEQVDLGDQREFCLVSTFRSVLGYACWLVDSRIRLSRSTFPFQPPCHAKAYEWMFGGRIDFGERRASIQFDSQYLELPVLRDDRALREMLERPLPLIVFQYRRDRLLSRRIRDLLRTRYREFTNADDLAIELNVSTRSLYRHLSEEGTSLQKIKDQVRRDVATYHLKRTEKSLKQIAVAAGFLNEASFSRAFRTWTGMTPGDFRQSSKTQDY